jgi:hypothetical protein
MVSSMTLVGLIAAVLLFRIVRHALAARDSRAARLSSQWLYHYQSGQHE